MNTSICMLGDGAWATAMALVLADNGYTVTLWCPDAQQADCIEKTGYNNRYLPGVALPSTIKPTAHIASALASSPWVFEAIPVAYMRSVLVQAEPYITPDHHIIILSKGIEKDTQLLPGNLVAQVLSQRVGYSILSGPSFASDVIARSVTAVALACPDVIIARKLSKMIENEYFHVSLSNDMVGVQVVAALKNVIALAVGLVEGAGYGDNTKALVLTQGLREISLVSEAMGGCQQTAYGLAGVGDVVLTAYGASSRNRQVGFLFAKGESLSEIITRTGYTPEGINTIESVRVLAQRYDLSLPICMGIYEHIFQGLSLKDFLNCIRY